MTKRNLIEVAKDIGVRVIRAKVSKDCERIGIHLLNPTAHELEDAISVAERDMFPAIIVHNARTWPQRKVS